MPKIEIRKERCKGCQLCVIACPKGCIKIDRSLNKKGVNAMFFSDEAKCTGCSFCAIVCPDGCIEVYK